MIKVTLTGIILEYNFGSPSILHGVNELLNILYKNDYQITNYQKTKVAPHCNIDFQFPIYQSKETTKQLLVSLLKDKMTGKILGKSDQFIETIKESDIVVDLFGICFCDNFNEEKYYPHKAIYNAIGKFFPLFVAKLYGVKTSKNTCSYGPMKNKINSKTAKFTSKYLFDVISAREIQSKDALIHNAKVEKNIIISPDVANLMRYNKRAINNSSKIGISTSHQIITQWGSEESYIDCIVKLCLHIDSHYNIPIVLIPNEYNPNQPNNDLDVSNEIKTKLEYKRVKVYVLDVLKMTSSDIKNAIAECDVVIASRYHSCVAALSSGVPTLVIGWHFKYDELLNWYNQNQWIISNKDCNSKKLIDYFDVFWQQREQSKSVIKERFPIVRQAVIDAGKIIFSK